MIVAAPRSGAGAQVLHERWGLDTQAERHDLDPYVDPDLLTGKAALPERLCQ